MKYNLLETVISSNKLPLTPTDESKSFYIAEKRIGPYVTPSFEKVIYDEEKPDILLIGAVGATGKTTLTKELSHNLQLPILDLGQHKPVGDNTLTGVLTSSYEADKIGKVFQRLSDGEFAILIDGVDEGRSKTNSDAFNAFLDDVGKYAGASNNTTFVMLGRTQSLEDCFLYLDDLGLSVGLLNISPFDIESAKDYVDAYTGGLNSDHAENYKSARNKIFSCIENSFIDRHNDNNFDDFIGYPPVLDSISTVLESNSNYYDIIQSFDDSSDSHDKEVKTLFDVSKYIMDRERDEKVVPQILNPIIDDVDNKTRQAALQNAYSYPNQSARLVALTLGSSVDLRVIPDTNLNDIYQEKVDGWVQEHPFLAGDSFRNTVFEAVAIASLMLSGKPDYHRLAKQYTRRSKSSYHILYMVDVMNDNDQLSTWHIPIILSAALEFRSAHSMPAVDVSGLSTEEYDTLDDPDNETEIQVDVKSRDNDDVLRSFSFETSIGRDDRLTLQSPVGGLFVTVPCEVALTGGQEFEFIAPVEISADSLSLEVDSMVFRPGVSSQDNTVVIDSVSINDYIHNIRSNHVDLKFLVNEISDVEYPIYQFAEERDPTPVNPKIKEKYIRLRRIIREFRSHSKGALAKYKDKIEHQRVLQNTLGEKILKNLINDGILYLDGVMYFINQDKMDSLLGINWHDLRLGKIPNSLTEYLKSID